MIVSNCCSERMDVMGVGDAAYYICAKCSRPTHGHFVLAFSEMDLNGDWHVTGNETEVT